MYNDKKINRRKNCDSSGNTSHL